MSKAWDWVVAYLVPTVIYRQWTRYIWLPVKYRDFRWWKNEPIVTHEEICPICLGEVKWDETRQAFINEDGTVWEVFDGE